MKNMVSNTEPKIRVGIMSGLNIEFSLGDDYLLNGEVLKTGEYKVSLQNGEIEFLSRRYDSLLFLPSQPTSCFTLKNVIIGKEFHWEREENQVFRGGIQFIVEEDRITAINLIEAELYLTSVISSEMRSTSSMELLKAHAVISRSWLMAQLREKKSEENTLSETLIETTEKRIRWYDHHDHKNFDVCADDHCQRYQGITRESTSTVAEAIRQTRGEVLMYDGEICDTRFSKSCGGATELFENCWEERNVPYLESFSDSKSGQLPDLTQEDEAEKWILSQPDAFCATTDKHVLSQVLNGYDQETTDFYRWEVTYNQKELSDLIRKKSGIDFGEIIDLIPVRRGTSGRLVELKIVGSKTTLIIGKELEIRKMLSESHLYSSAFIIKKEFEEGGVPARFRLYGAGWGHGVGLCQIGAAMMAEKGYGYKAILEHYYRNTQLKKLYN